MPKRLAITFAAALLVAMSAFAADVRLWTLSDPKRDDHGGGSIKYPMTSDYDRGDLDLVSLTAYREGEGTTFEAAFARPVKSPTHTAIDTLGKTLDQVARLGFYTINLDIYIDKDGVEGSGSRSMLPGRKTFIDSKNAWEKAICLTPDPQQARAELKRIVVREEKRKLQSDGKRAVIEDELRAQLRDSVDDFVFFPTMVRVAGNKIRFFVPDSFLNAVPSADWSYVVAVSGADIVQRHDQSNRLLRIGDPSESLMILPVAAGRPTDRFGGGREDDDFQPPLIDIIVPAGEKQETVLSKYDPNTGDPVVVRGVKPATK